MKKLSGEDSLQPFEIWADTYTGVCYLWHQSGYSGGLTVLLDRDGKPVIDESVIDPDKFGFFENKE